MKPMRNRGLGCWAGREGEGDNGVASGRKEVRRRVARLRTLTRRGRSVEDWANG